MSENRLWGAWRGRKPFGSFRRGITNLQGGWRCCLRLAEVSLPSLGQRMGQEVPPGPDSRACGTWSDSARRTINVLCGNDLQRIACAWHQFCLTLTRSTTTRTGPG